MVEELLPTAVSLVTQVNMDKRVVPGPARLSHKRHSRLMGSAPALFDIALCAGADDVLPGRLASHASGDNVVKRQLAGRVPLAAVLASVLVAGKDISAIEFYLISRQTVVE